MDEFLVEELESTDVPESELSEFTETEPLQIVDILVPECDENYTAVGNRVETGGGTLIKKFVYGEGELPEYYTKLQSDDEEDDREEMEVEREVQMTRWPINLEPLDEMDMLPSTSKQAAETAAKLSSARKQALQVQAMLGKMSGGQNIASCSLVGEERSIRSADAGATSGGEFDGCVRKRTVLNPALEGLMGEANLSFARGQIHVAEKLCLEIIRQNPLAPEPFETLAEIYEMRGDTEKYLNFLTIAAHLNPHNRDQWIRIADLHIAKKNYQLARVFYTKAIKVLQRDHDLRLRKARLLEMMGDKKSCMATYLKMIPHIPPEMSDFCLTTAKNVARYYHGISKYVQALEAMESAYSVCANNFTMEDLNLYLELLISNNLYDKVVSCLRERTGLEIEMERENNQEIIIFCVIPDDYLPDIRSKLCVALIKLHAYHLLGYLIQNVHENIPLVDDRMDLYVDIAEALMQEHKYAEAIELLRPISDGDTVECPAFIWLHRAECLRQVNRTNEAIECYNRVVEMAPFCFEAKFTLSALLKQQGRHIEAVKALEQSGECGGQPMNARLLYERCLMLQQIDEIDECLQVGYVLLARYSIQLRTRQEVLAATNAGTIYNVEGLKLILQMRNLAEDTEKSLQEYNKPHHEDSNLTIKDEYKLFLELICTAIKHGKLTYVERLCFAMITTKRFLPYHSELQRIIALACYFNNDCAIAFSYLRELIPKNINSTPLWNFLSLLVQKGQDLRYHKFVRRLVQRCPEARQQRIFLAHYHLNSNSLKYALNYYVPIFKEKPQPIVALCIAVVFNQLSLQRKVLRKTAGVAQSLSFALEYAKLRAGKYDHDPIGTKRASVRVGVATGASSEPNDEVDQAHCSATQQEIYYNIARIYHQSSMPHLAVDYYERALAMRHPLVEEHEEYLGLRQEIAYNLHLIYRASGNMVKARHYLYQYCVA